jgi:hypothetical protein
MTLIAKTSFADFYLELHMKLKTLAALRMAGFGAAESVCLFVMK